MVAVAAVVPETIPKVVVVVLAVVVAVTAVPMETQMEMEVVVRFEATVDMRRVDQEATTMEAMLLVVRGAILPMMEVGALEESEAIVQAAANKVKEAAEAAGVAEAAVAVPMTRIVIQDMEARGAGPFEPFPQPLHGMEHTVRAM